MKIALTVAVLGSVLAPAFSLSYLEGLNKANPVISQPSGSNGASYLDACASPGSTAPSGGGLVSYLDALPKNTVANMGGSGITTYLDTVGGGSSVAPVAAAPVVAAPAPSIPAPVAPAASSGPVAAGGNYLEALASADTAGSPTGGGIIGYLDALPRAAAALAGAGIRTHTDLLPVTNTAAGTGVGAMTYTDSLSGGRATSKKAFSPFGSSPSFVGTTGASEIGFTLEASDLSALVAQLQGNGGTIRLTGSIENVAFN
jgi:hypothetical protein